MNQTGTLTKSLERKLRSAIRGRERLKPRITIVDNRSFKWLREQAEEEYNNSNSNQEMTMGRTLTQERGHQIDINSDRLGNK